MPFLFFNFSGSCQCGPLQSPYEKPINLIKMLLLSSISPVA